MPGVFGDRHVIVMVSVTEETPYLSGLLATVTAMTLMTLIYGLILDEGMRPYFVDSWSDKLIRPSARSGAEWPARLQEPCGRCQGASDSCSHPSLSARPRRPQMPAWRTPKAQAPRRAPPALQGVPQLHPTPCGRRMRCRRQPASPTAHPEDSGRPRKSASHP